MKNVLIIYASMTGNTQMMAEHIADGIKSVLHHDVVLKDVWGADVDELEKYDGVLLGTYTWMDGTLPDEFIDFYDDMEDLELNGLKTAVFGTGDTMYDDTYGVAIEILEERLKERGAELLEPGLLFELTPSKKELAKCVQFGTHFAQKLEGI